MKPGLVVLPLEVWTDIFVYPWITRQQMGQIMDKIGDRKFAEKLQFRLHDYGKQSLRFLEISYNLKEIMLTKDQRKRKIPKCKSSLAVTSRSKRSFGVGSIMRSPAYKDCKFPQIEMPENITKFKQLSIRYLDHEVLAFLDKLRPLFTNVLLNIRSMESEKNMNMVFDRLHLPVLARKSSENVRSLLAHLLPMIASIRGICCDNVCVELLEQHFPGTLTLAKELHLSNAEMDLAARTTFIPAYLNWLSAPLAFGVHGPRFLRMFANSKTIVAMVEAVRKVFSNIQILNLLIYSATFIIFIERKSRSASADEFKDKNEATNEELAVRNAIFVPNNGKIIHYVEVLRHSIGEDAHMRDWIEQRAYFEKKYNREDEAEQMISIHGWPPPTIGPITQNNEAKALDNGGDELLADDDEAAGPSTSAKRMKKE